MPSVCNKPVTGSQALRSSHRLGRCCLWWTALPPHGIGSVSVSLIILLLLTVDSDDWNEVTLLFQPTCIQSYNIADMIRAYSGILHGIRTLYGQMAEGDCPLLTCIKLISALVCYVSVVLFLQQFVGSRRSLPLQLLLTFSCSLHGFLRDQNFQTDRIPPLTDITVLLNELWAFRHSMNVGNLRHDELGSTDLRTSATIRSHLEVDDGVPQTTLRAVMLQTVRFPWLTESEQQCRHLQEIRTCQTSRSRSPSGVTICRPFLSCLRHRHRCFRRLHLRWTVISLCTGSCCVRRAAPAQKHRRTSPCS